MTKIINGGGRYHTNFSSFAVMKKLSLILLLCLTSSVLFSQNQVLTKQNGGVSWQETMGGCANVRAVRTSNQTISSSTNTTVTFSSEDYDMNNTFNPSTGIFTPQAGYYVIKASVNWSNTNTTSGERRVRLCENGSLSVVYQNSEDGSGSMHSSIHTVIYSYGTDDYSIMAWQGTGGNSSISSAEITIYKLPNPNEEHMTKVDGGVSWEQQSSSLIKAKKTSNLSIPSGTNTAISYSSEDFDINSEFDPSTGVFTPSQSDYYVIMATANWDVFNGNSGTRGIRLVKRLGVASIELQKINSESGSGQMFSSLHTVVYYNGSSGHTSYVAAFQDSGSSHNVGGSTAAPGCTFNVYRL